MAGVIWVKTPFSQKYPLLGGIRKNPKISPIFHDWKDKTFGQNWELGCVILGENEPIVSQICEIRWVCNTGQKWIFHEIAWNPLQVYFLLPGMRYFFRQKYDVFSSIFYAWFQAFFSTKNPSIHFCPVLQIWKKNNFLLNFLPLNFPLISSVKFFLLTILDQN